MIQQGIVIKSTGSWYTVKCGASYVECKIKGKLRISGIKTTNPIAVGDRVSIEISSNIGNITSIAERKNYIIRKSTNLSRQSHILAANLDHCFIVVTIVYPEIVLAFIDRYLVSAEAYNIPASIIFNKIDLYDSSALKKMEEVKALYTKIGYNCYTISAKTGEGIGDLKTMLNNKINLFTGNSGVGKSSIINSLDDNLALKTGEISDYHLMGKHTTTFYEMFELESGGYIIDSPGIKGFGIVEMDKDPVSHYFPEMLRVLDNCKYSNCTHQHEPGCEVKNAVISGSISQSRYDSYLKILKGDDEKYR